MTPQRATMVAVGVSIAAMVYSGSLVAQRFVPALKDMLVLPLDNVRPTYYLRVLTSIVIGLAAAFVARHRNVPERRLAGWVATALAVSVVLACVCP